MSSSPPIEITYHAVSLQDGTRERSCVEALICLPDGSCIRFCDRHLFEERRRAEELARLYMLLGAPPLFLSPLLRSGALGPPMPPHGVENSNAAPH